MDADLLAHWAALMDELGPDAWAALLDRAVREGVLCRCQVAEIVRAVAPERLAA